MNASDRAWLKPSATRSRWNASRRSRRRPVCRSVCHASSPVSSQVSGTRRGGAHGQRCVRVRRERRPRWRRARPRPSSRLVCRPARRRRARRATPASSSTSMRAAPRCVRVSGDRSSSPAASRAEDPRPLHGALGGDDADLEHAVVGLGVVEGGEAPADGADVADEDAARLAVEPVVAVDLDPHPARAGRSRFLAPVHT